MVITVFCSVDSVRNWFLWKITRRRNMTCILAFNRNNSNMLHVHSDVDNSNIMVHTFCILRFSYFTF